MSTGAPVWTHRDAARFVESIAGAGPRGTPTLSAERVYALGGATGLLKAARSGGASYTSPHLVTIDGIPQVLLMTAAGATSIAPNDGKPLWEHS